MDSAGRTESFRVLAAQSGDAAALDQLLTDVQAPLYRYLLCITGERALAEDALQDSLVRICRKLGTLRDPALFRPWSYRVARRIGIRTVQRERRRGAHVSDAASLDQIAALVDPPSPVVDGRASRLRVQLAQLPPAARAVVALHYLEDLSLREAADVLGIPVGTAKSRLSYGLDLLRRKLRPLAHDER